MWPPQLNNNASGFTPKGLWVPAAWHFTSKVWRLWGFSLNFFFFFFWLWKIHGRRRRRYYWIGLTYILHEGWSDCSMPDNVCTHARINGIAFILMSRYNTCVLKLTMLRSKLNFECTVKVLTSGKIRCLFQMGLHWLDSVYNTLAFFLQV